MDPYIPLKPFRIMAQGASSLGLIQCTKSWGLYFSVALEHIDDLCTKECHDLFIDAVTAAVVDA